PPGISTYDLDMCNLLDEGNAFFREKEWEQAVGEYTEGLKVSCYAEGEEIQIPKALLESLYVNRAAAYHSMGKYDEGVEDCNNALVVCKESRRALYRKALCLKELSRYMEAYDCTSVCLLSNPQDKQVNELERDLAVQLKMKIRKPYVSSKVRTLFCRNTVVFNPLSSTHEFLQACSLCYPREGPGIYSYVHKPDLVHNCKQDILLCRRKAGSPSEWTRVRPIPTNTSFWGPFVLCRVTQRLYGEKCTFAYNQLEIDVWTVERKGKLNRNLLFETTASKLDPVISVIRLLEEHKGMFIFLCQECYDSKPRIISKRFSENPAICSNLDVCHNFDTNKCLAFVVRTHNINYSKVRPLSGSCHLDLCHQAIRYGCQRENSCVFAHSIIELKTWKVQRLTGISSEKIVEASLKHYNKLEQNSKKEKGNRPSSGGGGGKPKGGGGKSLDMKMKFVCAQCWRGGLISEPDKALKYCNAKARHTWTKDRRVLLVKSPERSKWVQVRPLPHAKNPPLYYDMCAQILEKRKCNYTGNCTFAHSQEEREMWMYMKNNDLRDMQQVYDMWLALTAQSRPADGATFSQPSSEEKFIAMPTDCAEVVVG
uniref:Zinc finger CCCH-type containing 7B n=1 Tax=Nothobranchius furzeri TaxID=105023 RepID=A0A8C6KLL0_NOTFU